MREKFLSRRTFMSSIAVAILMAALAPAFAFDIGSLLNNKPAEADKFRVIHVEDLSALMADANAHVNIYDANGWGLRSRAGVIPGANLLSSSEKYDVASTLPASKSAEIVFYCADPH